MPPKRKQSKTTWCKRGQSSRRLHLLLGEPRPGRPHWRLLPRQGGCDLFSVTTGGSSAARACAGKRRGRPRSVRIAIGCQPSRAYRLQGAHSRLKGEADSAQHEGAQGAGRAARQNAHTRPKPSVAAPAIYPVGRRERPATAAAHAARAHWRRRARRDAWARDPGDEGRGRRYAGGAGAHAGRLVQPVARGAPGAAGPRGGLRAREDPQGRAPSAHALRAGTCAPWRARGGQQPRRRSARARARARGGRGGGGRGRRAPRAREAHVR